MGSILHGRKELRDRVAEMLRTLGGDPEEVSRQLELASVRGTPRDPQDCAIALFLTAILGADPAVRTLKVFNDRVVVFPTQRWLGQIVVRLSEPLRLFVADFDRDRYPQLTRKKLDATRVEGASPGVNETEPVSGASSGTGHVGRYGDVSSAVSCGWPPGEHGVDPSLTVDG